MSRQAEPNQVDNLCETCGEPKLMIGEWELVGGICANWKEHLYGKA